MNTTNKILIIVVLLLIAGASFFVYSQKTEEEIVEEPPPEIPLAETATYKIEFIASWSQETHPNDYPSNAHFSPFVAYSHNNSENSLIFQEGQTPTDGIEQMAETGKTNILNREIDDLIISNLAFKKTQGDSFDSPGEDSSELEFSKDYSYVTFVSMIAPSPDWFVAQSTNLIQDNKWVDKVELDLVTYDAGSDSGETLTAGDIDTDPKEPTTIFPDNLQNLGKIIITKL